MTQYDIYKFLKFRSNELFTSGELGKELNLNRGQVTAGLRKLRKIFPIVKLSKDKERSIYYAYSEDLNNHMKDKRKAQWNSNGTTMKRIKMVFTSIDQPEKKHYLKRWCLYCGSRFIPNGKFNEKCHDCQDLSYNLGRCDIEHIFRPSIAKMVKTKYIMREKVSDIFKNIEQRIIEKQIWHEEGKKPIMVMRLTDLKDILNIEKRRMEE